MRILISNDDGYLAPGISALAKALEPIAEVAVVAPDSNRSGASSSLTLERPISVYEGKNGFLYTTGTPSAGINHGQNMGEDTIYSGTVAAAMEGYLFDIPSIAFSQVDKGWAELESAALIARDVILRVYDNLSKPFLLNVNIPNKPYAELKKICATRLGRRHESEAVIREKDPFDREIFWIGPSGPVRDAGEGTDFHAIRNGHVSVTPLQLDWTHTSVLSDLKKILE